MAASENVVDCGERLDIAAAGDLHANLVEALGRDCPVRLDISRLTQVDTAGVQLLVAFTVEAHNKGIRVEWHGRPEPLHQAARRLGLADRLASED